MDLKAQYARLKPEIDAAIARVLAHGQFILGPEVKELEAKIAAYTGAAHCVGVANGTDALTIALMAEGVGAGDAVFVPAFTFTATAEAVLVLGATPVFCDVDARTFNLDPGDLARRVDAVARAGRLTPRAVMAVDLFGLPADYDAIAAVAQRHGLFVLADAAQSFGARAGNRRAGAMAPATTTSFFPAKPLGCYGDGGALMTDDVTRAELYRSLRAHGTGGAKYDIVRVGFNSRLDTLQAAILLAKLPALDTEIAARERLARRYDAALAGAVETPPRPAGTASAWAQYTIQSPARDRIAQHLKSKGIPTAIYYPKPMHLQPAYAGHGEGEGSLPVSEALSARVLSLPFHADMDDATADRVAAEVRAVLGHGRI
jgi:dTDP-4-amino-4,6-dideoxygalactose transaminase